MSRLNEFINCCAKNNVTATRERIAVVQQFLAAERPVSCETLQSEISEMGFKVSLSTVHRTKQLLLNWGLANASEFSF